MQLDRDRAYIALLQRRTKRWVMLTEAGRQFLPEARRTQAAAEGAVHVAQRAAAGEPS